MKQYTITTTRERWSAGLAATVTSGAVLSGALLLFAEAGQTPWFSADSEYAATVERCQAERASADRHRCVRHVAAIAAVPGASAPVMLSRR